MDDVRRNPAYSTTSREHIVVNAMSVDVEDYFQVSAFSPYIARSEWETMPCRVERNVDLLLELFATSGVHATFFVLGWIAERYPAVVSRIVQSGHELASHGYGHHRASDQTQHEFFQDIVRAKNILEQLSGSHVNGYRAPSFSIGEENQWAFDMIAAAGYRYSSSVYPVKHDHYGMPDSPRFPYRSRDNLVEIPVTTTRSLGRNLPAGGGGYFRFIPYSMSKWAIKRVNTVDRQPAIFYMHPWEVDPAQPRIKSANAKSRFRHYVNLTKTEGRLRQLTKDFRWDRIDVAFAKDLA